MEIILLNRGCRVCHSGCEPYIYNHTESVGGQKSYAHTASIAPPHIPLGKEKTGHLILLTVSFLGKLLFELFSPQRYVRDLTILTIILNFISYLHPAKPAIV